MENRVYGLVGLSQKAGKVDSGELACQGSIESNSAYLVILAEDASKNTSKKFKNKCNYRKVPIIEYGTKKSLGNAIGKAKISAMAITDKALANNIAYLIKQSK